MTPANYEHELMIIKDMVNSYNYLMMTIYFFAITSPLNLICNQVY